MALSKINSKSPTVKRILREAAELSSAPSSDYHASPASDSDIFEWHFTLRGPPNSAFADGIYHGRIVLPAAYPLRPPSFRFLTPSGRFETNREICLSISGHHEESWQPAWGIRTALVALRAFMETEAKGQLGGLDTSEKERNRFAELSGAWKCGTCGQSNREILAKTAEGIKATEQASEGNTTTEDETVVPKELTIKYKDEMKEKSDEEAAALAESFVQTTPNMPPPPSAYPPARPAQNVPQPTGSVSSGIDLRGAGTGIRNLQQQRASTAPLRQPTQQRQVEVRVSRNGTALWIDRAIIGVALCLLFLILRMILRD